MSDLLALEYLKEFFRKVVNGRRDYENLFSMTIGISTNNIKNWMQTLKILALSSLG